ncbi:SH2 domain protein [Cooperia oncophora]
MEYLFAKITGRFHFHSMSEADLADPNKIDPWLLNQKFFHGFLSREDLPALLQNHGDFLVRCNEGDKTQPREVVVSVLYDPDGKSKTADQNGKLEATRNFVVQSALSNKTRKYFIDSRDKFESLEDLLTHHSETPLVVNQVREN